MEIVARNKYNFKLLKTMSWKKLKKCLTNTSDCDILDELSLRRQRKSQRTLIIEQYNQPWRFLKKPDHESGKASEIFSVV